MSSFFQPLGIVANDLEAIKNVLYRYLKNRNSFKVFVFGSRISENYRKYSDLDLWIESDPEISDSDLNNLYSDMSDTDIPIKIDLITPRTCLLEYREGILQSRRLWIEKN